jgi:hypothetical protein
MTASLNKPLKNREVVGHDEARMSPNALASRSSLLFDVMQR